MPGRITHLPGGVALNVAMAVARRGMDAVILSAVGRDAEGEALIAAAASRGVTCDHLFRDTLRTDVYMAIEDDRGLIGAIADAHALEEAGSEILTPIRDGSLASAEHPWRGIVVIDGNLTSDQLTVIADEPALRGADLRVVPASPGKAERLEPLMNTANSCFYLNRFEAEILVGHPLPDAPAAAEAMLARGIHRVIVTDGDRLVADGLAGQPIITATPPHVTIARVTGAGDNFLAAHLSAEDLGADRATALHRATAAAAAHVSGKDLP